MTRLTLAALNALDRGGFVAALRAVFEDSPWIVERAWKHRPFGFLTELHGAMTAEIDRARRDEQLSLLRAHPDLGANARMSTVSATEQAGAGLTHLSAADFERLRWLNAEYREKFGFPFLMAVKGCTVSEILAALESRLRNSADQELAEGLRQVEKIGFFRLQQVISEDA